MTCCQEKDVNLTLGGEGSATLLEATGKRKKKFTGGNASKRHRDRVNIEFSNLAKLLPFSESVIAKLDKSSILRLAVSFIRAKSFFKDAERSFDDRLKFSKKGCKNDETSQIYSHIQEGNGMLSQIFSQALDGFLLVLTEDMKVLFVSDSVRDYLGYCQAGIIHENFLQFVNPSDHAVIQSSLMYRKHEIETKPLNIQQGNYQEHNVYRKDHISNYFDNGCNRNNARRHFVCRMKCAFSCSSRFYTAYRTFQFSGHLRRSVIQEGREQKHLNSLVLFAVPVPHNSNTTSEPAADRSNRCSAYLKSTGVENNEYGSYYERFDSGFRIEPTLRPHISPIPVSRTDHAERHSPGIVNRSRTCSLIEIPQFDVRTREYIHIARDSQTYIASTFSGPASNESRYSDYSDDSKCSPASSPNLVWKQRSVSPYVGQVHNKAEHNDHHCVKDMLFHGHDRYIRRSISEPDYCAIKRRASPPQSCETNNVLRAIKCEPHSYAEVYHSSMVNTEPDKIHPHDITYHAMERINRKRTLNSKEDTCVSQKRSKINSGSRSSHFNITSLLGLDQTESKSDSKSITTHEEDIDVCALEDDNDKLSHSGNSENNPKAPNLKYTLSPMTMTQC